jgi:hypothetical protein
MLLRRRPPALQSQSITTVSDFQHIDRKAVAMLRWLVANDISFVLVGPIAEAIRSGNGGTGPITIVPAPFQRNYARLCRALWTARARLRMDGEPATVPLKLEADALGREQRWTLRCGAHDLDVEGRPAGDSRYQELLYEAGKFDLAADLSVEVAAPEDLEHYAQIRRTGSAPEIRITRNVPERRAPEENPAESSADAPKDAEARPERRA